MSKEFEEKRDKIGANRLAKTIQSGENERNRSQNIVQTLKEVEKYTYMYKAVGWINTDFNCVNRAPDELQQAINTIFNEIVQRQCYAYSSLLHGLLLGNEKEIELAKKAALLSYVDSDGSIHSNYFMWGVSNWLSPEELAWIKEENEKVNVQDTNSEADPPLFLGRTKTINL